MSQCSAENRIKVKPIAAQDEKSCEWDSITGLFPIPGCSGQAAQGQPVTRSPIGGAVATFASSMPA